MTPSKTLFYLCLSFVVGVFFQSLVYNIGPGYMQSRASYFLLGFFVCGSLLIVISFFNHKSVLLVVGFCILVFALGVMRFQISQFTIEHNVLKKLASSKANVTLVGFVADAPDIRDTLQHVKISVQKLIFQGKQFKVEGNILATFSLYRQYQYLDTLQLTGKLGAPKIYDDFNYQDYLLKDSVYALMYYPKVVVSAASQYNPFTFLYEKILFLKEKMRDAIYANFEVPHRLLLEGVILGNNKNMTQNLRDKLNVTGLRYLTAISGVHVIIISAILMTLLLALGFWRGQAFYASVIFIWLYIMLTGFSASGIRAAIMGSIFLLAQKLGRQNTSSRTIVLAAALMLLQNPLLLFYDVGFQLSFAASLGIIYARPVIETLIKIISKDHVKSLVEIVSVTMAAQIFILPIMVYNFGNVSMIAPLTSLLVLPIMPWLMIFGFLTSMVGIFSNLLGWIFSVPCWLLLTYFIKVLDIFSQPWALATFQNVSWVWLMVYYLALFILIKFLQKFQKPKFLGY